MEPAAKPPGAPRSQRSADKRQAIMAAAEELFLRSGYAGSGMEELTRLAGVSKQTLYVHFRSKEELFVEVVASLTRVASERVHDDVRVAERAEDVPEFLVDYALRQLAIVLDPRLLRLRRLVIGEMERFPDLARAVYENGPARAITSLAAVMQNLSVAGHIQVESPTQAAQFFNWIIMGQPVNAAMMLGEAGVPSRRQLRSHARAGVALFLTAYQFEG